MGIWSNAFKIPGKRPLSEDDKAFLLKACQAIKKRELSQLAALTADSTVPAHNIFSQAVIFGMPFLNIIFDKKEVERLSDLLQNPAALDFFKENL